MPFPSELRCTSFACYSPRGTSPRSISSRAIRDAIKNDTYLSIQRAHGVEEVRGIEWVVDKIRAKLIDYPFLSECLGPNVALVPIPRSAPLKNKDALWPSKRICEALVEAGLGGEVAPLLKRVRAVQKAATAPTGQRPGPEDHFESTVIDDDVPSLLKRRITMVDDIVTRGSSFVGMFRRLSEAFPGKEISCFALISTEKDGDIPLIWAPLKSTITRYPSGKLWRSSDPQQSDFGFF